MGKKVKLKTFAAIIEALPDKLTEATINGARMAAARLVVLVEHEIRNASPFPLVDRGRLVQQTQLTLTPNGAIVRNDAPHAAPLEYGARPFTPPRQVLLEWAKRKGFENPEAASWAIWQKFRKEGMPPRRFFAKALAKWRAGDELPKAVKKALKQLPSGTP